MYRFDPELLPLLEPWYADILDYQAICDAEKYEFEIAAENSLRIAGNFNFDEMDEAAVSEWEAVLKIVPDTENEDLDFRRFRIKNRLSTAPPFTLKFLRKKLDEIVGAGQYTITTDYENYAVYVDLTAENALYASEISYTVDRMKPAHIVFRSRPQLLEYLTLAETVTQYSKKYNYKLGAWGLGLLPFAAYIEGAEIVTREMQSIQQDLIDETAQDVANRISSARVTGVKSGQTQTVDIEDLEKSVEDGVVSIQYDLTPDQLTNATSIALLDENDNILTQSAVYIPIGLGVRPLHKITVEEAMNNG